jgi:hypothetical protein
VSIYKVAVAIGGCSSMVEPQPSKLMAWVRFPSPAPSEFADVAQLVEHVLGKDEVSGSIPDVSTMKFRFVVEKKLSRQRL